MEESNITNKFWEELLGITDPWGVAGVEKNDETKTVLVKIAYLSKTILACPKCAQSTKWYDHRKKVVRHLDTCDYQTLLEIDVPRVKCKKDGVQQIAIPFVEGNSRYTNQFERGILFWLEDNTISTVAEHFKLSWNAVDRILQRAVDRGLKRRRTVKPKEIGIDETANRKGHDYITVILDKDRDCILDVLEDRSSETLSRWFKTQKTCDVSEIRSISMDMWDPYIKSVRENIAGADEKIAFDRFHVAKHFNKAIDTVRRHEHREYLSMTGESPLSKTRYEWLTNSNRTDNRSTKRRKFLSLSKLNLLTARAWRIKEAASMLWDFVYMNPAEAAWKKLLRWISHCRIAEMIKVGKTIRNYLWGILNAIHLKTTNSMLEAKNSCIQRIKKMACGFRNKTRFKRLILFHLGNLDVRFST